MERTDEKWRLQSLQFAVWDRELREELQAELAVWEEEEKARKANPCVKCDQRHVCHDPSGPPVWLHDFEEGLPPVA